MRRARALGYLARRQVDGKAGTDVEPVVDLLRRFEQSDDRSIVLGAVTGLAYLGDWRAVLRQLGAKESYLHKVAQNVFEYWVPGPLTATADDLKGAARFVGRALRDDATLHPDARDTLGEIKEQLVQKLGYYVSLE